LLLFFLPQRKRSLRNPLAEHFKRSGSHRFKANPRSFVVRVHYDGLGQHRLSWRMANLQAHNRAAARGTLDAQRAPVESQVRHPGLQSFARLFIHQFRGGDELKPGRLSSFFFHWFANGPRESYFSSSGSDVRPFERYSASTVITRLPRRLGLIRSFLEETVWPAPFGKAH